MIKKQSIINDFKKFRFISFFERDNSVNKLIFKETKMNYEKNTYENKLFYYQNSKITRIKTQNKASIAKFYDKFHIIYTSKYEKKQKKFTKVYIQGINQRKALKEFVIPFDISNFFLLDKNRILFVSNEKLSKEEDFKYCIEKIHFYENGNGYTYNDINMLYVYDMQTQKFERISNEFENVETLELDKDNAVVYYTANRIKDVYTSFNKLYSYDYIHNVNICLYDKEDCEIIYANSIKDGLIVIASKNENFGINENPKFYKLEENELSEYVDNVYSIDNSICSDIRYGRSNSVKKFKDAIYFLSTRQDKCVIYKLEGKKTELFFDKITCVDGYDFLKDELVLYGFDRQNVQEIYALKDDKLENITKFSERFKKHISSYIVETINFNSNKDDMKGYVILPHNFDKDKKYPAVLAVHGGPKTVYSENFIYEMYLLSQNGYFVFFTNPHGSDGKDDKFADIRGRYGSIDYYDLMKFTDIVIEKYESIDKERLAIIGGSYGGFMTNYVIGQTNRFKAAVTQRSITNWVSFYGTSDIGYYFATDQNDCEFDIYKLWDKSPLKYVNNIKTPTLIIHSDEDYRCPLEQAMQLFTHLKVNNVKTKMIVYKKENHDLSRSGSVKSRVSRLEEIINWLEENLK